MLKDMLYRDKGTIMIGDKKYYFKRNDADVELLIEHIADLFHIKHAHYISVIVEDIPYYISEDLNHIGHFITADDLGLQSNHMRNIRDFVLTKFPEQFDHLMDQIMKMFFMDLMILNIDRNTANWGFLTKDGKTDICILDNSCSFVWYNSCMTACENKEADSYIEITNILEYFPKQYRELFLQMFQQLDVKQLEKIIQKTEKQMGKELPYKDNYIRRFECLRNSVDSYLQQRQIQYQKIES